MLLKVDLSEPAGDITRQPLSFTELAVRHSSCLERCLGGKKGGGATACLRATAERRLCRSAGNRDGFQAARTRAPSILRARRGRRKA